MNNKYLNKILVIIILILIVFVSVSAIYANSYYFYGNIPKYYHNIPIIEKQYDIALDNGIYGDTHYNNGTPEYVIIYTTGNYTFDRATYYHEMYHLDHNCPENSTIDDENAAENYAAQMVQEYKPIQYT